MTLTEKGRNVLFVLAGVAALVLKQSCSGPLAESVHSYGGNVAGSFAVYFLVAIPASRLELGGLIVAATVLLAVQAFEATNGFGVMTNVNDPLDFAANAAGVGFALAIDRASSRLVAGCTGNARSNNAGKPAT